MGVLLTVVIAAGLALLAVVILDRKLANADRNVSLADRIDALLPQTQCGQCTYTGCRPYAEAIAAGDADFNQCPPGGNTTAARLATLLGRAPRQVNHAFGDVNAPVLVAFVDEERCIGCALCLPACPVDAIVGATRHTHTVIALDCTGCKLCIAPCPVDCIEMRIPGFAPLFTAPQASGV